MYAGFWKLIWILPRKSDFNFHEMNFHWVRISQTRWMRTLKPNMTWKAMEDKISVFWRCNPFITSHMQIIPQSTKASLAWNKVIKTSQTSPLTRLNNVEWCLRSLDNFPVWLYELQENQSSTYLGCHPADVVIVLIYLLSELSINPGSWHILRNMQDYRY